jgi:uncharacterized protein (DUF58 family)
MNKSKRTDRDSLVKKAAYLRLMAIKLAEDMKSGTFKSLYKGQGIEFSGVRDYIRGDDVRSIDWNVTARMNKPFVKVFEEDRELQIFLIVDTSLSMQLECQDVTKYDVLSETAALITIAAELNNCSIGAVFLMEKLIFLANQPWEKNKLCFCFLILIICLLLTQLVLFWEVQLTVLENY